MAVWTYEVSTEHNVYPNLTVYDRFADGVLNGWKVVPNDNYVMYDTTDENYDVDSDTLDLIQVTHYYTQANLPLTFNWDNFTWVAVPRSDVTA